MVAAALTQKKDSPKLSFRFFKGLSTNIILLNAAGSCANGTAIFSQICSDQPHIVFRSVGKYAGATLGAVVTKAHPSVKKYLGLTLLPQAGVAIAMSQLAVEVLPAYGEQIRAVVLTGTLVYELLGPVIAKIALTKAGETHLESGSRKKARANA